jgi:hypothetical protein
MPMPTEYQSKLLESILIASCSQAEQLLEMHCTSSTALARTTADLELSPLLERQLVGTALRLAKELCLSGGIRPSMLKRFRSPVPRVAIEAQRRAIGLEVKEKGLPVGLAGDYVDQLQRRIAVPEDELPKALWAYAALYDDLWSDPRIGAQTPTRRIMLAMATVLRARSAELNAVRRRRADTAACLELPRPSSPGTPVLVPVDVSTPDDEAAFPGNAPDHRVHARPGGRT